MAFEPLSSVLCSQSSGTQMRFPALSCYHRHPYRFCPLDRRSSKPINTLLKPLTLFSVLCLVERNRAACTAVLTPASMPLLPVGSAILKTDQQACKTLCIFFSLTRGVTLWGLPIHRYYIRSSYVVAIIRHLLSRIQNPSASGVVTMLVSKSRA